MNNQLIYGENLYIFQFAADSALDPENITCMLHVADAGGCLLGQRGRDLKEEGGGGGVGKGRNVLKVIVIFLKTIIIFFSPFLHF